MNKCRFLILVLPLLAVALQGCGEMSVTFSALDRRSTGTMIDDSLKILCLPVQKIYLQIPKDLSTI